MNNLKIPANLQIEESRNQLVFGQLPMETIKDVNECSQSIDSSFEEGSLDSEVLKIKKITKDLTSQCTENLKHHKKAYKALVAESEGLTNQMTELIEKKKFIAPIKNLKEKTSELTQTLSQAYQCSKLHTDDEQISLNDGNIQEIFTKLQFGIESLKDKDDFGLKVIEKCTEATSANQTFKDNNARLENEGKNEVCSCVLL